MVDSIRYEQNAEIYKVLANPKRLGILNTLGKGELSVEELADRLKIRKTNISQHLARLRHARLVRIRREGLRVYYRVTDTRMLQLREIIEGFAKRYL